MVKEELVVQNSAAPSQTVADFTAWVDDPGPLLNFAQLIAGDAPTEEDLLQTALARTYLKWAKIGADGRRSPNRR